MNLIKIFLFSMLICALFLSSCDKINFAALTTGTISGKITNATVDSLIAGATITTNPSTSSVTTNSAGDYRIENVSPGTYIVTASKGGYLPGSATVSVTAGNTTTANISINPIIIPTQGLVAYYPFNGNANDESDNGNNGMVHGATLTTDRFGNVNRAYFFNGTSNYIDCGNNAIFNIPATITLSCWVKTNDSRSDLTSIRLPIPYSLISKWNGGIFSDTGQSFLVCMNAGHLGSSFNDALTGADNTFWVSTQINDDVWHLVTVTADRNLTQKQIKVYIDGQLNSEWPASGSIIKITTSNVFIGVCDIINNTGWYLGSIDDVRIYNRVLSGTEIQALYHEGD